jgi:hypothetical protein
LPIPGFVGGMTIVLLGGFLVATLDNPWALLAAVGCLVAGLGLLAFTAALRRLVYRGRPVITGRMFDRVAIC